MAINIRVMAIEAHGAQEVVSALQLAMDFMGNGQPQAIQAAEPVESSEAQANDPQPEPAA